MLSPLASGRTASGGGADAAGSRRADGAGDGAVYGHRVRVRSIRVMQRPDRTIVLATLAVLAVVGAACGTTDPASQERLPPIVTTTPTTTTTTTSATPQDIIYVVQSGDSLSLIASRFSVTVTAIMERNGLENDAIQAGQELEIPQAMLVVDDSSADTTTAP
jgi:LysM repeat protein